MQQQERPSVLRPQQRTHVTKLSVLLCAVVFLSCLIPSTEAQNATCQVLNDGTCNQFVPVGTSVFVPGDITLDFLVLYANRLINLVNFVGIPEPCRSLSLQLICYTWLRPCQDPTAFPVVPKQPCIDLCFNYEKSCYQGQSAQGEPFGIGFYFPTGYNAPLNCSNPPLDIWAGGQSFYWPNQTQLEINGVNQTFSCNLQNPVTPPAEIICEDPLSEFYKETSRGKRPYCAFTCPLPSLTDSEYDSAKIMQGIVGWFSWAGSTILIFAMLLMPRTRDFPRNLILMCACAANVAAGAIILPSMVGYDNIWCGGSDKTLEADLQFIFYDRFGLPDFTFNIDEDNLNFKSDPCSFQGAILQFGFLAAVFWWAIIAFNMSLELYFGKLLSLETPKWKWLRFVIYNILAWGTAFVLMVIPASAGKIAFSSAATYCFVSTEDDYAWISVFWFIPVGISLVAGSILFILALIRITILMIMIRKVQKLIMLYLRLSIFIVVFLIIYAFIFAYNIQIANDKSNVETGYEAYYKCLIYSTSSCSLSNDVSNYDLVMLKGFAISVLGIFLFFLFMSWDLLVFYYDVIKSIALVFLQPTKPGNLQNVFHKMAYASSTKSRTGSSVLSGKTEVTEVNSDELEEEEDTILEDRGSARRESPRVEKVKKHKKAKKETSSAEEESDNNESSSSSSG